MKSRCDECGEVARDAYHISPRTGNPDGNKLWCVLCYEKLHARHIRNIYRERDRKREALKVIK